VSDRPAFQPLGLDHVVLRVADQAASRTFYEDVLGCTLEFINEPIHLVQLRFGDALIDLLPAEGPPPPHGRGMDHVCLSIRCDDLAAAAKTLRARGVDVDGEVRSRRGAWGVGPSIYIRDPDGYQIELKPRV
jgi:catechol 2,3-dioxygenase-like lactoylglutathione lyase family enzyme